MTWIIFLILHTFAYFKYCFCGHIYSWDMTLNYNNAGYTTEFTLPFSLENSIVSTDYFKIIFLFSLHTTTTSTTNGIVPNDITVTYAKVTK